MTGSRRTEQIESLLAQTTVAAYGAISVQAIQMAVDQFQQGFSTVKPKRRHIAGEAQLRHLKIGTRRVARQQPRIGAAPEKTGILTGPGNAAGVPDVLRKRDRSR